MDPDTITLDPARAVFDVDLLKQVGRVAHERSFKRPDSGHNVAARTYALAGLLYCAHCDQLAARQDNPLLRTGLIGKGKTNHKAGSYRHRPGLECGCTHKQVHAPILERDFMRLCNLLTLDEQATETLKQAALVIGSSSPGEAENIQRLRDASIAKAKRKLENVLFMFENADISRETISAASKP